MAEYLGYTPTTSSNWNSVPVVGSDALDTLASSGIVKSQSANLILASPNGGSGVMTPRSLVSADLPVNISLKHLIGNSSAPTIAAGAGAGTSPTISITGTDLAGAVTVTSGSTPSASSVIVTITFNGSYGTAPYVQLTPANAATALLNGTTMVYVTATTTTFVINAGTVGITPATTYLWNYASIQ